MKEKSSLYLTAAASVLAASTLAWAQPATSGSANAEAGQRGAVSTAAPSSSSTAAGANADSRAWERDHRASKIIGTDVRNRQGEKVGDIKDLIIDRNGAITLAIVSTGGFLGIGDRLHAVPWSALQNMSGKDRLLDIDKARLKQAPGFDSRNWPNLGDERWLNENQRYFGSASPSGTAGSSAPSRSGSSNPGSAGYGTSK
ncbi:MAG: PRC-barrel domain-containing protein [Betaproteobacteria bacterium]